MGITSLFNSVSLVFTLRHHPVYDTLMIHQTMKYFLVFALLALSGCDFSEREQRIQEKEKQLSIKEAELHTREQALLLKEQELTAKQKELDSTAQDTTFIYHPEIIGRWNVRMECTETNCPGSAIGDTKLEEWDLSYQDKLVIAKVLTDNKVSRIYTGDFGGNFLELTSQSYDNNPENATIMLIRLQKTGEGLMEGQRQIIRPERCRIVYTLKMNKKEASSLLN